VTFAVYAEEEDLTRVTVTAVYVRPMRAHLGDYETHEARLRGFASLRKG